MTSVHDVAAYILAKTKPMTSMKLQKLVYYAHAWHLVWEERKLFGERIEAWANGPVIRELYDVHRGKFSVGAWPAGKPDALDVGEKTTVDAVIRFYGAKTAHELSQLSHREEPWKRARAGVPEGARCNNEITDADMFEYYDGLTS